MDRLTLGRWGEDRARTHLEARGWTAVATNVRWGREEIDLIVRRDDTLAFVEVKTRSSPGCFGPPAQAVTRRKRARIRRVARAWLHRHPHPGRTVRFDVVSIVLDAQGHAHVEVIEDAWR